MSAFRYRLDPAPAATLGLIVLQEDETLEQDMRRLLPTSAQLHVSRVPSGKEVTRETLAAMGAELPAAARLFPSAVRFDAVGYGCTSGTAVIGAPRVAELIRSGTETQAVTEPVSALLAACGALGVRRLAFLSPYIAEVSARLREVLAESGVESPVFGSFDEAEEAKVARIDTASVIEAATELGRASEAEALFLSCTNLRTLDAIPEIERRTGKPVLSSNFVLGWHLSRLAGLGFGVGALAA
ncbi:MAG: Asp/Glu racemase [Paracoccaceae bacterium]|nr:Asp/Glu racemase [Paracoccaceae bacterium]